MNQQALGPKARDAATSVPATPSPAHSGRGAQSALEAMVKSRIPPA
jgi:hypothetical protein